MKQYVRMISEKLKVIRESMLSEDECRLIEVELENRADWDAWCEFLERHMKYTEILNEVGYAAPQHMFINEAYCALCGRDSNMIYRGKTQEEIRDWPGHLGEDMLCPMCECNGRIRYMLSKLRSEYSRGMKTYLYERKTKAYAYVESFIPEDDLLGSEFLGEGYRSGEYVDGILHEDAMNLSFDDNSFDLMLSMEVFEHVSDYEAAFREAYRVLKPGGKMLLTLPLYTNLDKTYARVKIVDGKIIHLHEAKYHGDPINPGDGILEFTSYGWDILEFINNLGFSSVKQIAYFSVNEAYLGRYFYFELIK